MKIRNFAFVAALLLTLSFSSCSNENESLNKGNEDIVTRVSFSIAIPKGEPVTYATTHDADEYGIESLWLYEYDADGKLLSAPVDIKNKLTGPGPEYIYERNIIDKNKGTRRFIFVANENVPDAITVGTTLTTLKSKLATKTLAGDASCKSLLNEFSGKLRIPMTGAAVQAGSDIIAVTGAPATVSVEMTRIVARIDIDNQVPNLVITDVKLVKANSHSNLFLNGDYAVPTSNTKVSGITPFVDVPATFKFETKMAKAFYLYEGHQNTKEEAVHIEIAGKIVTVPVFYRIPLWKNTAEVVVKRNHVYQLTLGDGTTTVEPNTMVKFQIEDTPWNEVTMNETFNIIAATHSGSGIWIAKDRTVTVDNAAHGDIVFDFTTKFIGHNTFTATVVDTPDWITANFTSSKLTVDVQANNAGNAVAREAVIEVVSDVDPTTKYIIKVKQAN